VATTWFGDGGFSAYDSAAKTLVPNKILLASNGVVDLGNNGTTRIQRPLPTLRDDLGWRAQAKIRVDYNDYFLAKYTGPGSKPGADPNNEITCVLIHAPATSFAGIPTISQLWDAAKATGNMYRFAENAPPGTAPGFVNTTFNLFIPSFIAFLQANTKHWVGVVPAALKPGNPATQAHRLASFSDSQGRAVSLWGNRTPNAPVITSPTSNSVVAAGSTVLLSIANANDPDYAGSGAGLYDNDRAGVHVQYAPRPTADNPSPTWTDLPFADGGGVLRKGWWIQGSNSNVPNEGLGWMVGFGAINILCGSSTPSPTHGLLPSGDWQIRVRTFDYGHPFPEEANPLGASGASGIYTAYTYPTVNTSPWSAPIFLTVSAQVPPPIPLWPVGSAAVPADVSVTLTWQYRNTAVPPFNQNRRTIRIRPVGSSTWTTLVNNALSSSQSYTVTGYTFTTGTQYEWQVRVTDTDGVTSDWSASGLFWIVPAPNSGGVRPVPSETTDGATLGCGTHRVLVYRRGGTRYVGELKNLSYVDWHRTRDDISTSKVVVSDWDVDCGSLLAQLQTWAYEIVIIRDNGYSKERVWEGPITLLAYERDSVTIQAKDVMAYAYRRIIKQKMTDTANGDTVTSRAARVLQNVFAPDDPNILPYLRVLSRSDDAMQYRSTPAYSRTAFEEVDDMASNAGLDYVAIGRSILLWGTRNRIGTLPEFRDSDLGNSPIVSEYGMSLANVYAVSDGNGIYGEATRLGVSGNDETYGLVEMLSSSWASDSAPDSGTYTQAGLEKVRRSFEDFAERSIADRYPPPVVVRVPDNTTLNPDTVISIQQLVPGVAIPLRSTGTLRAVVATQKLDAVKVVEQRGKESISITMSPFSRDDGDIEEGEVG